MLARSAIVSWKWSRQLHGHALQSHWDVSAPLSLFKRQWSGGESLKEKDSCCSFDTAKQSTPRMIGAELFTWPSRESKCPPNVFPSSVCFSEHPYVSIEHKICMDFDSGSDNGEYCAYIEKSDPISADGFLCHHWYKQRPISKPVKKHSFQTGMPIYMGGSMW